MKKVIVFSLFLCLLVSSVMAIQPGFMPLGVGAKYAAMGGAAAAIVDDITSAYYNPAGILKSGNVELKIGAGAALDGLNDIVGAIGNSGTPSKFLSDNFNKTVNVSGGFNSIVGLNIAKIGISLIPAASLTLTKPTAGTLTGTSLSALAGYEGILTLGSGFSIPGLPIGGVDFGANIKSVNLVIASSSVTGATSSTDTSINYSGTGFDLGAKAHIDTPLLPVSVGIVMKDIAETLKGKTSGSTTTYEATTGNPITTPPTETAAADFTAPVVTVIGASTVIPGIGLKLAVDIDSVPSYTMLGASQSGYSLTHIGVEYPLLFGIIVLRAGSVSGGVNNNVSQTTYGLGLNLGININAAMMTDAKNSKNNSTYADIGFAF